MGINKVEYGSTTLIDLTGDTVMPENLLSGETAHNAAGEPIVGTASGGDISTIINAIYPVGSIYMSVNNTDPSILFEGTTWEAWGNGKVPVGVDTNDTDFDTAEETGGAKTENYTPSGNTASVTLTAAQSGIPAHSHGLNSHTHSVGAHAHGLNSHTHSVGAHAHGLNSHKHSIPALSGTAASNGDHAHAVRYAGQSSGQLQSKDGTLQTNITSGWSRGVGLWSSGGVAVWADTTGAHKHTVSTTASTSGAASGNTANSTAFNTGAASGNTANSTAFNTGAASGSTANNTAGAAAEGHAHTFTGTQASISHLQPYITCYMWKRTA